MEKASVLGNQNDNANISSSNIIVILEDKRLYVPIVTLSAKDNQKLSKLLNKGFKRSVYWNKEIRKLTTRQGEDYTTRCLLNYEYIKIHHKLIAVHLSGEKELDADLKAI